MKNLWRDKKDIGMLIGFVAAFIAVLIALLTVGVGIMGLVVGPFVGIGHGILEVVDSNVDLVDWYNHGARIADSPAGACSVVGVSNDVVGNIFCNSINLSASNAIEYWNQAMAYRSARLGLLVVLAALFLLGIRVLAIKLTEPASQQTKSA
jgi:hypothetical protein